MANLKKYEDEAFKYIVSHLTAMDIAKVSEIQFPDVDILSLVERDKIDGRNVIETSAVVFNIENDFEDEYELMLKSAEGLRKRIDKNFFEVMYENAGHSVVSDCENEIRSYEDAMNILISMGEDAENLAIITNSMTVRKFEEIGFDEGFDVSEDERIRGVVGKFKKATVYRSNVLPASDTHVRNIVVPKGVAELLLQKRVIVDSYDKGDGTSDIYVWIDNGGNVSEKLRDRIVKVISKKWWIAKKP